MKTLKQVNDLLSKFESQYGLSVKDSFQGQEQWYNLKLGVLSASNAGKIVAKNGSDTRTTYMAALIAQVCTGVMPEISSYHMEWGKTHENPARAFYKFQTGRELIELPFVFKDDTFRCGVSPDCFTNDGRDVEIKCSSNSENHIKFLMTDAIKSEWSWQLNFNMWCRGTELIDFCSYDPRMKAQQLAVKTFEKDPAKFKRFEEAVPEFIEEMDKHLEAIGIKFGEHWKLKADKIVKAV